MIWLTATLAFAQDVPAPEVVPVDVPVPEPVAEADVAPAVLPPPVQAPDEDVLAARLLGPAPTVVPAPTAFASPLDVGVPVWWPIAAVGVGAGLLFVARKRLTGRTMYESQLLVVGRTSLGGSSALLLVDVAQPGGAMRRLVIATGGGTPTLLADLGDDTTSAEEENEPSLPAPLRHNTYAATAAASAPRSDRKAAAMALIDEVVGTRRAGQS